MSKSIDVKILIYEAFLKIEIMCLIIFNIAKLECI